MWPRTQIHLFKLIRYFVMFVASASTVAEDPNSFVQIDSVTDNRSRLVSHVTNFFFLKSSFSSHLNLSSV